MPNPPAVAELLLHALLPVNTYESVSGDLLEEYRESRVTAAGELRADLHRGGLSPDGSEETFLHWIYWDNVGSLLIAGIVLLVTSFVCGGIGAMVEIIAHWRPVEGGTS